MVILVDLTKGVAYVKMVFKVIRPMSFGAIYRYSTVDALKVDVYWRL
jgi:hypothetical protein